MAAALVRGADQPVAVFQFAPPKFVNKKPTAAPEEGRHASANAMKHINKAKRTRGIVDCVN